MSLILEESKKMSKYVIETIRDVKDMELIEEQIADKITVFQQASWLTVTGRDLFALVCRDEHNQIKGYLPLVKTSKYRVKSLHIPPYTPYFGPVIIESDLTKKMEIIEALVKKLSGEDHIDFVLTLEDNDLLPYIKTGFTIEAKQTHICMRKEGFGAEDIHSSKRRYLKKLLAALDAGEIKVKRGKEAIADLIALNHTTETRASFRGKDEVLKKLIEKNSEPDKTILVLYDDKGTPLAGAFCPRDKHTAYHLTNASARNENSLLDKANILSTCLMIRNAFQDGLNFDFEGSNIPGVANFYRMMGGKPRVNFRIQRSSSLFYSILRSAQRIRKEKNVS